MAASKDLVAAKAGPVYSIDPDQTLKASKALLAHIKKAAAQKAQESSKQNLLDDSDGESSDPSTIWLTLTTKRHIADKTRLQPGRIALPHSLHPAGAETTICLITADPQRAYKDIVASDAFPADLRARITRVIDLGKLKAKFSQYEAQRKLLAEHDVFLGDDRIVNRLPKVLGKTFYKTTLKRPVPVVLTPRPARVAGKRTRLRKTEGQVNAGSPADIAKEIRKALASALVSLTPSTTTAVRVAASDFAPQQVADNVAAVAAALVDKWVPQGWRNVRAFHIKGPETAALPIWLTDELWLDDKDVVADKPKAIDENAAAAAAKPAVAGKKRKALEDDGATATAAAAAADKAEEPAPKRKTRAKQPEAAKPDSNDNVLDQQISDRKSRLRKAKAKAATE
ncbi:putative ribosome biogenesis protein [Escovopsis weberi]|uniref:Putative ribosome biogenesis protein n=1 Tax=Escovopsis weberi TaxID=150374 RepID=A0A0M9VV05_ESCWE|nr:putative ribosome biogenesis protein [Escovopsis weberi]